MQLERKSGDTSQATKLKSGDFTAMAKSARRCPGFSSIFPMKHVDDSMETVVKDAPGIEHYWGRVELAPGRGEIHLHIIAIGRDKAYLEDFHKATTTEKKAKVIEKKTRKTSWI